MPPIGASLQTHRHVNISPQSSEVPRETSDATDSSSNKLSVHRSQRSLVTIDVVERIGVCVCLFLHRFPLHVRCSNTGSTLSGHSSDSRGSALGGENEVTAVRATFQPTEVQGARLVPRFPLCLESPPHVQNVPDTNEEGNSTQGNTI